MNRGEVYWYTFKSPDKRRRVVVLTRDISIPRLNSVTVAPITSTVRGVPSEVILSRDDGMAEICAVNLHNIQTIQQNRLRKRDLITELSSEKMAKIAEALKFALAIE